MSKNQEILLAKSFEDCKIQAQRKIKKCFHPECNETSINSHILQRNGILSKIAEESHVIELQSNQFKNPSIFFKKIGLKDAFSFYCFCNRHDSELFQTIEREEIDFNNYKNRLLFTLRTIYNEKFRKIVNIDMYKCLMTRRDLDIDPFFWRTMMTNENLGLKDIEKIEQLIWQDLNNSTESFTFKIREVELKEICLSAFYNYESTNELMTYEMLNGKQKEDVINIFVNLFPYKDKSIFMMGYRKVDENEVLNYVEDFFTDEERQLETKITNLMMFQCETWIMSNSLYKKRIQGDDEIFKDATSFATRNPDERNFFDLNIFSENFKEMFKCFREKNINRLQ